MPGHLRLTVRLPKDAYRLDGELTQAVLAWALQDLAACMDRCPTEQTPALIIEADPPSRSSPP